MFLSNKEIQDMLEIAIEKSWVKELSDRVRQRKTGFELTFIQNGGEFLAFFALQSMAP